MTPFFIVGSPRSGTTILRNYIRSRTDLICPEETFYYRWTFPFGSNEYLNKLNSPLQRKHREIDEIDEFDFQDLLNKSSNRKELLLGHVRLMGCSDQKSFFEKTPQHIYSVPLILSDFPKASILFVVRNPLDSIASIYSGKTLKPGSLKGAICYWNESYYLYKIYQENLENIFLVRYEDFAYNPNKVFLNLSRDLCLNVINNNQNNSDIVKKPNIGSYLKYLNNEEVELVYRECEEGLKFFKYL